MCWRLPPNASTAPAHWGGSGASPAPAPQPRPHARPSPHSPIVSGLAARIWSAFPGCSSHDVRAALERTALDVGPRGWDATSGSGLLQAEAAYDWLLQQPCASKAGGKQQQQGQQRAAAVAAAGGGDR
jgi:hypothetical protein